MSVWINRLGGGKNIASADEEIATARKSIDDEDQMLQFGYAGARLMAMADLNLPVQPGFVINSDLCRYVLDHGQLPTGFGAALATELDHLKSIYASALKNENIPFCVSTKANSKSKIAGIAGPIYHIGMNADAARQSSNAMESWRQASGQDSSAMTSADCRAAGQLLRFLDQYSENALGITPDILEDFIDQKKQDLGLECDGAISLDDAIGLSEDYKKLLQDEHDISFPDTLNDQLETAILAACKSWTSRRAMMQRQIQEIDDSEGLAIIVRISVFADFDAQSGQGYVDTRNARTGENSLQGAFSWGAVGEQNAKTSKFDIDLAEGGRIAPEAIETVLPGLHAHMVELGKSVETYFGKVKRLGLVVHSGHCFISDCVELQLSPEAEMKISIDLAKEGNISREEAILRIDPISLEQLLHPSIAPETERTVVASGVPASPGAACGEIVFSGEDAIVAHREGRKTILVRIETSPEDVHGMQRSEGILTIRGGMTSHAAVIARGMGTPCVCGAGSLRIDAKNEIMLASGRTLKKGDLVTLDGTKGEVLLGQVSMREATLSEEFQELMSWSDQVRRMEVRTNAESPEDVQTARQFGAQGVGLCRTEHMFFEGDRVSAMREMILADSEDGRRAALDRLLPMQESDFLELFEAANGQPITIRLLDPPLHEFLPHSDEEIAHAAKLMGVDDAILRRRITELHEFNPMLGHRGCRLAISYPEITEMQARAIIRAAIRAGQKTGAPVVPEIMVPLVALKQELDFVKERIDQVARDVMAEMGAEVHYLVGTMIEIPRAVIKAGNIARVSEFFSFGTNDLTQMTFGISRDDASPFLKTYRQKAVIDDDPFVSIDEEAVGEMIQMAMERGRQVRPDIKLGVCGEHGGDPKSVKFFDKIGLDYVSCSPFRVPIARLAAAQASILAKASKAATV